MTGRNEGTAGRMEQSLAPVFWLGLVLLLMFCAGCGPQIGSVQKDCAPGETCECNNTGSCTIDCDGGNCDFVCNTQGSCTFNCPDGDCESTCNGSGSCTTNCPGDSCSATCNGSGTCILQCVDPASCTQTCNGSGTCQKESAL